MYNIFTFVGMCTTDVYNFFVWFVCMLYRVSGLCRIQIFTLSEYNETSCKNNIEGTIGT